MSFITLNTKRNEESNLLTKHIPSIYCVPIHLNSGA